ncbi:uncharacterized protein LOC142767432 [Rhipicephalus microplus]|uniref:uncharacterized protein LOC142767432 n=1 Tax=Rhipicephalus microplus TaxID=6941 RepID=UPI003F6C2748
MFRFHCRVKVSGKGTFVRRFAHLHACTVKVLCRVLPHGASGQQPTGTQRGLLFTLVKTTFASTAGIKTGSNVVFYCGTSAIPEAGKMKQHISVDASNYDTKAVKMQSEEKKVAWWCSYSV